MKKQKLTKEKIKKLWHTFIYEPDVVTLWAIDQIKNNNIAMKILKWFWKKYNPLDYGFRILNAMMYVWLYTKILEYIDFQMLCLLVITMSSLGISKKITDLEKKIKLSSEQAVTSLEFSKE